MRIELLEFVIFFPNGLGGDCAEKEFQVLRRVASQKMGAQQGAFVHRQRNAPSEWFSEGRSSKFSRVELPEVQYCFLFMFSFRTEKENYSILIVSFFSCLFLIVKILICAF